MHPVDGEENPLLSAASGPNAKDRSEFCRIIRLSLAFCVVFMPFSAAQNFQTSQSDPITGARALALLYIAFTLANLVSGQIVQVLGLRASMFVGSITYVSFVFANIHYQKWMIYSTAIILGFGAALLWTAQGAFVTRSSKLHDHKTQQDQGSTLGVFNGVFFAIFQANQFLGNLIVAIMFQFKMDEVTIFKFCSLFCGIGCLAMLFVYPPPGNPDSLMPFKSVLHAIGAQFYDSRLILLVPYILLNGATQSFIVGDFASFATKNNIRFFVMAACGGFDAVASIILGRLSDRIGRSPVIMFGLGLHAGVCTTMLLLSRLPNYHMHLIALAICFGTIDAAYTTSVYAVLGGMFKNPEAAFANFKLFQSGMIAAAFFYRDWTDLQSRTIIISVLIVTSAVAILYLHKNVHTIERQHISTHRDPIQGIIE
uniref:Major facilitator superfamily (MFS) profile domain-containing protein n=1 Tax=Spongospora subterranea TaxID=70186 RepID=A0A0H5QYQ6_9EUKA|eukprot:CRZ00709.1 hypothetical protein [Spongospora subterranea]